MTTERRSRRLEQAGLAGLVRWGAMLARRMPLRVLWRVADAHARAFALLIKKRQVMIDRNLAASFPEMTPEQRRTVRWRSMQNAARTMAELLRLPVLSRDDVAALIESFDPTAMREAHRQGHGIIVISAHYGNWEIMGTAIADALGPMTIIVRNYPHPAVAELLNQARGAHGVTVISRHETRQMLRVLKSGGVLGILPDQQPPEGGLLMDFLGRPAYSYTGPAVLARLTGARVFACFCRRTETGTFRMDNWEIELVQTEDRDADAIENTRRINAAIERAIREAPENWLWLHNRWKPRRATVVEE